MNAHRLAPEDVMAYVDGQVSAAEAQHIKTHLAGCDSCRQLAGELRAGSKEIRTWTVEEPPPSLMVPQRRDHHRARTWVSWGPRSWNLATRHPLLAVGAVVVLLAAPMVMPALQRAKPLTAARETPETPIRLGGAADAVSRVQPEQIDNGPRIVRTATLRVVAENFDRIRPAIDRILQNMGGFAGTLAASEPPGAARSVRGTLRIPSSRFDAALAELRALGRVVEESQNAEDVTATVADLDARLSNSRVIEKRLTEVLRSRTGDVSDVLEVEREIARVRGEIEQMEAERKQLDRRIEYATLTLEIVEERAAAVNLGPVPIPTRLRLAIADGIASAATSMLAVTLLILRRGPALLLWALLLSPPVWWMLRRRSALKRT